MSLKKYTINSQMLKTIWPTKVKNQSGKSGMTSRPSPNIYGNNVLKHEI